MCASGAGIVEVSWSQNLKTANFSACVRASRKVGRGLCG